MKVGAGFFEGLAMSRGGLRTSQLDRGGRRPDQTELAVSSKIWRYSIQCVPGPVLWKARFHNVHSAGERRCCGSLPTYRRTLGWSIQPLSMGLSGFFPGWTGFLLVMACHSLLVVVFQIHLDSLTVEEPEGNSPIAAYPNAPNAPPIAL